MRRVAGALALVPLLLIAPAPAHAVTSVFVSNSQVLFFEADGGQANDVTITGPNGAIVVTDANNDITPGSGCSATTPRSVTCTAGAVEIDVRTNDLDDRARIDTPLPADIDGGLGVDTLTGGPAADELAGGPGADILDGAAGNDDVNGLGILYDPASDGGDRVSGGAGDDDVQGATGSDTVDGGDGADRVFGGPDDDVVDGGAGDDSPVSGGDGTDQLRGGDGNDVVGLTLPQTIGGGPPEQGDDVLDGGPGNDVLAPGDGPGGAPDGDTLLGGEGFDEVSYVRRAARVEVSKDGARNDGAAGEGDEVSGDVERVTGGASNDLIIGSEGPDDLDGGGGDDIVVGLGGTDTVNGGRNDGGSDVVDGGADADTVEGDGGNDALAGGGGGDQVLGGASGDMIDAGAGDDAVQGGDGNDKMTGGTGADGIAGGAGKDEAAYPEGNAVRVTPDDRANDGSTTGRASEGDDVRSDVEDVSGGGQEDTFVGTPQPNRLAGAAGEDYLDGAAGDDELFGGALSDTLRARDGVRDVVSCGAGTDFAIVDRNDAVVRTGPEKCERVDNGTRLVPDLAREIVVRPATCATDEELLLQLPRTRRQVPLEDDVRLPVGSSLDSEDCGLRLDAEGRRGASARATVSGAEFVVRQRRARGGTTDLRLVGCALHDESGDDPVARAARHDRPPYRFVSRNAPRGRRARRGRASASAVRGAPPLRVTATASVATARGAAEWLTVEQCGRTRTTVRRGTIQVRVLGTARVVRLSAGKSFTAVRRRSGR